MTLEYQKDQAILDFHKNMSKEDALKYAERLRSAAKGICLYANDSMSELEYGPIRDTYIARAKYFEQLAETK
jgi:hypothetical protein